jgi:hypothetical protein
MTSVNFSPVKLEGGVKYEHSVTKNEITLDLMVFPECHTKKESAKKGYIFKKEEVRYVHFDGKKYRVLIFHPNGTISKITK